jgi:perosamine synthetase
MTKKYFWRFSGNENKYLNKILTRGLRPKKEKTFNYLLEQRWSAFHRLKYSITANSCTSALHVALLSLDLNKGDEVLVPSLTPVMCANAIIFAGLTPVFVDVNKENFLIDEDDLLKKITKKTKVIMLVHMYGGICDGKVFRKIAKKYKLKIVEDCAESLGAKDENGFLAGTIGDVSCWSFQGAKHITCGDGGIIATSNKKIAENARKHSNLGFRFLKADMDKIIIVKEKLQNPKTKRFSLIGYNYRLNEFSAAIALAQFERLKYFLKLRRYVAIKLQKEIEKASYLIPQYISKKTYSTYYTLSVLLNSKKIKWKAFQKKFTDFGGDNIYAASQILQEEPSIKYSNLGRCFIGCKINCLKKCKGTPNAKYLQNNILNFCTNQGSYTDANKQVKAIRETINFFNAKS